jgi:hypothetical protein
MPDTSTPGQVAYKDRWCQVMRTQRPARRKTDIFEVVTHDGLVLAEIRWYARWRKYALFTRSNTVWEEACLTEVSAWLIEETARHRQKA